MKEREGEGGREGGCVGEDGVCVGEGRVEKRKEGRKKEKKSSQNHV